MKKLIYLLGLTLGVLVANTAVAQEITQPVATEGKPTTYAKQDEIVSTEAKFPGGNAQINKFISANINYPSEAINNELEGRITLSFIIEKDGSIGDVKVKSGGHQVLEKEANKGDKIDAQMGTCHC